MVSNISIVFSSFLKEEQRETVPVFPEDGLATSDGGRLCKLVIILIRKGNLSIKPR